MVMPFRKMLVLIGYGDDDGDACVRLHQTVAPRPQGWNCGGGACVRAARPQPRRAPFERLFPAFRPCPGGCRWIRESRSKSLGR